MIKSEEADFLKPFHSFQLSQGAEERARRCAVAEGRAHMRVEIDVAGAENETSAELKRVGAQAMLPMAGCLRARPCLGVVTAQKVQEVRRLEAGGAIREPLLIDKQRKCDSGLLAKKAGVAHIAKTDGGEIGAPGSERLLMVAQLRNMLAAEYSAVMTEEDDYSGTTFP